jgi:hypothetical protein
MISYYYYEERRGRLRTRSDVGAKLSLKRVSFFYDDRNVSVREWWCSEIHRVRMLLKDPSFNSQQKNVVVFCCFISHQHSGTYCCSTMIFHRYLV